MHVRWIAASFFVVVGVVAVSGSVAAQSKAVLGKDDAAFAAALMRSGYADMAERLVQTIEKEGSLGPEEAVGLKALHLDLRLEIARREADTNKRIDLLRAILEEKENLIEQYKGRPVAEEARNTLPDVYRILGDAVIAAIGREKDPDKIAALTKTGGETYSKAEDSLRNRIKQLSELDTQNPEIQNQLLAARYNLPRTLYFHALLYPKEEFRRKDLLNQAIKGFQEFSLDFSDTLQNYDAIILEGLCHKELGELEDAKSAFRDAFRFPETQWGKESKDAKGFYPLSKDMGDTVSEACLQWMNVLLEQKDNAGAIALGKEFFDTTPGATEVRRGLAILAAMGDAYIAMDDAKNANDMADKLVKEDPNGPWGAKGREIQSRTLGAGKVDPGRALAIATAAADRGDEYRGLQLANMAIGSLKGTPEEAKLGAEAYLFIGSVYARRNMSHEAALAFDLGAEKFPRAEQAPELVYQAIAQYQKINSEEKRPYFKKRIEERIKLLATNYPNSDRAQGSITFEADQAMLEGRYLEGADQYAKVMPNSKYYLDAQAKAGEAYLKHAVETLKDKPAEAKTYTSQAETLLKKVLSDVNTRLGDILPPGEQVRMQAIAVRTITRLAELYLSTGRESDVLTLLEGVDEKYGANADALSYFWGFRIRALIGLDRLDEAITKLDGLAKKDPGSKAIASAARLVAVALDEKGKKLLDAGKKQEGVEVQKRAAQYYSMAGRALLAGAEIKTSEVEGIAKRLFALALDINEVPKDTSSFIGWDTKKNKDASLYQIAADLFERALSQRPNEESRATLGKIYGFLGNWEKSAKVYGDLFDTVQLLDTKEKKLNMTVARNHPNLVLPLFEWGVAENKLANVESDGDRFRRAQVIFDTMVKASNTLEWRWWWSKYYVIKNKADMGNYLGAKSDLNQLERETNDLGVTYGLGPLFAELKKDLGSK
jgi:hypothetical protein